MNYYRDPRNEWGDKLNIEAGFARGMDLWSKPGSKIIFVNENAGYSSDIKLAQKHLVLNQEIHSGSY